MRRGSRLLIPAVLCGCWGSPVPQEASCAAYVTCVRALDVRDGEETNVARFVEGGFCWNNPTLAEGCSRACTRGLAWLRERDPALPAECQP